MNQSLKITGIELILNGENGELATIWYHIENCIGHSRWLVWYSKAATSDTHVNTIRATALVARLHHKIGTYWEPIETDEVHHVFQF